MEEERTTQWPKEKVYQNPYIEEEQTTQ